MIATERQYSGTTGKIYNAETGQLFNLDDATGNLVPEPVKYLDKCHPWQGPQVPEINWQQLFAKTVLAAIAEFNRRQPNHGFVFDRNRITGFDGVGIIDGNVTIFAVRADKANQPYTPDFAADFRALEYVTFFVNHGGAAGIHNRVMDTLRRIDDQQEG